MPSEVNVANYIESGAPASGPITWASSLGLGAPTFTTSSAGERLRLRNTLSGSAANYAIGVETDFLWNGVDTNSSSKGMRWYGGTTKLMELTGGVQPALILNGGTTGCELYLVRSSGGQSRITQTNGIMSFISDTSGNDMEFYTNSGAGATRRLRINNAGAFVFFTGADTTASFQTNAAFGDIPAGMYWSSSGSGGLSFIPSADNGTAGAKVCIGAWNGAAWKSVFEAANVASGEPNAILVKSGGKVGIGTSSPGGALHIAVDSSVVDAIDFQDTRASHARTWAIGPGVGANDVLAIRDITAGANRFNIDFSGNIGIGTATPGANLNVHGASGSLTRVLVDNDATYGVAFGVDASNVGFYGSTNATPVSIKTSNTDRLTCGATDGLLTFKFGVAESGVTRRTSGASYTMLTGDRVIVFASGSSGALNLIASPETGRVVDVRNDSGGDITLTPAAGNINGAGTLALPTGTGWALRYDGTQWITFG